MKGITKSKGIGIAAAGLLAALLISATIMPAMGTHGDGADDRIDKLVHDLENAVTSYNEAVTSECSDEDIASCMENVDKILAELEALGMEAEFTTISENRGMATVDVNVTAATEGKQTYRYSFSANEEQLEIINQFWGQDITIGEFLEKVMPEALVDAPEEMNKHRYATKMNWPDRPDPSSEVDGHLTGVAKASKSSFESTGVRQLKIPIVVKSSSDMDAEWPDINFSSYSKVLMPYPWDKLPFMEVYSGLLYEDGTAKYFDFDDGYNVYKVEASGTYSTDTAGDYQLIGVESGLFPPGITPPGYTGTTDTDWIYVGP